MTTTQYILIGVIAITFVIYSINIIKDFSKIFYINKNKYTENRYITDELNKRMTDFLTTYEQHPHVQQAVDKNELAHIVQDTLKEAKTTYYQYGQYPVTQMSFDLFLSILIRTTVLAWIITFNDQILIVWLTICIMKAYMVLASATALRRARNTLWVHIAKKLDIGIGIKTLPKED